MNNILFNVSVTAFQKMLEKEATFRDFDEETGLSLESSNEKASFSIKELLTDWISGQNSVQPAVATTKFKNWTT